MARVSIEAAPANDEAESAGRVVPNRDAERMAGWASQPLATQTALQRLLLATKRVRTSEEYVFERAVTQIDLKVLSSFLEGAWAAVVDTENSVVLACGDRHFATPLSATDAGPCWPHVVRAAYEFAACCDSRGQACHAGVNADQTLLELQMRELTVYFKLRGEEAAPTLFGIYYGPHQPGGR